MKIEDVIKLTAALSLNKKTLLNILYTQSILADSFGAILKKDDLSPEQYYVLKILQHQKGKPLNMCDIQERMISKTSNTTRLIDKLLIKGYVTREVCSKNRRKIEILITKTGLEALKNLKPEMDLCEKKFYHKLTTNELENLNFLLEKYRII